MGIKSFIKRAGNKAADTVSKLSVLSNEQLEKMDEAREKYLEVLPDMTGDEAMEQTTKLLSACGIEIFGEYLQHISEIYVPVGSRVEYDGSAFNPSYNIRFFNITRWVTDKKENSIEKLVNVYQVLLDEDCNIALVFNRTCKESNVYIAVVNTANDVSNTDVNTYCKRIEEAIHGNFPGSEWINGSGAGRIPCLNNSLPYSVAAASNIPGEKSEKFISQTIEKLLDGVVPDSAKEEYTLILLATPTTDVAERKLHLAELYSALAPYAGWQTNFTYNQTEGTNSSATFGVNAGVSAGIQQGQNQSVTNSDGTTDSTSKTDGENQSEAQSESNANTASEATAHTDGTSAADTKGSSTAHTENKGTSDSAGASVGVGKSVRADVNYNHSWSSGEADTVAENTAKTLTDSASDTLTRSAAETLTKGITQTVGKSVANTLGKAVTKTVAKAAGTYKGFNLGGNFGANFARSSNVTASVGKNEGITQSFTNYNIKHTLEVLEQQMKRHEQSTALGMWDFAAYVLSEDQNVANNVAHAYLALTQGEQSYMSQTAVNLWRGDMGVNSDESRSAREICEYLRDLRHPVFGLNQDLAEEYNDIYSYPSIITATTGLSGKELAYSLNFPRKSVAGLPVIECAEFGRSVTGYSRNEGSGELEIGKIFHMNHVESLEVKLSAKSLCSHTFITGSTGSGKSNTVYKLLSEATKTGAKFLVVEPAKGEYKHVLATRDDVNVYGTNPYMSKLLRLNPFSFPDGIHVYEHLDRLVEIFNVCWPMYAAMPAVLKTAIEKSYTDCGWDMLRSVNKYGEKLYPTFADVARNIKEIIDSSDYDNDNKGAYKGSLLTRLQSLTNGIFGTVFTSDELSCEKLFEENTIVDLSRVGSVETKSLIMGILVLKLQEHRMTEQNAMNSELRHITVLEEAHNILRRTSTEQSAESANLLGKSVEMISNAIAEMRTYGEGFIIVDQAPGLLDMSSIRNTNTKLIMRLPDQSDRELVGRAANLNEDQITELAKLPCGVAAVYQNEWVQPVLCKVDEYTHNDSHYEFEPDDDAFFTKSTELASQSLLDCIMNKEIFRKGSKVELQELKRLIIKSKLDSSVKADFMEYLNSDDTDAVESLRKLIYDFLSAENAIEASRNCTEISEWAASVVNGLRPSIAQYTTRQINLALALLVYEQTMRDSAYNDLFCRFTEVYREKGGVL